MTHGQSRQSLESRLETLEQELNRYRQLEDLLVETCRKLGYRVQKEALTDGKARNDNSVNLAKSATLASKIKILLMEDDLMIRNITGQKLSRLGYETTFAGDGESALQAYREAYHNGVPFDVVILDLMIEGGIGGREVIRTLTAFDPQVRAVVATGYINDPVLANYYQHGFKAAISKPFTLQQLENAIEQALNN